MTEHTINVPLLRKILEHITAHPEEWKQSWWAVKSAESSCGTACCVAGWAVSYAGYQFRWSQGQAGTVLKSGENLPEVARGLLGLTEEQADELFFSGNKLKDLWAFAHEFTNGEIEIPLDLPN